MDHWITSAAVRCNRVCGALEKVSLYVLNRSETCPDDGVWSGITFACLASAFGIYFICLTFYLNSEVDCECLRVERPQPQISWHMSGANII